MLLVFFFFLHKMSYASTVQGLHGERCESDDESSNSSSGAASLCTVSSLFFGGGKRCAGARVLVCFFDRLLGCSRRFCCLCRC